MKEREILDVIASRISVRKFKNTDIPSQDIDEIIRVGLSAPSAGNRQPWRIIIVRKNKIKSDLADGAYGQKFIAKAPVILVICAVPAESEERYGERGKTLYVYQDTAALTENILLASHCMGYGSVWIGAFDEATIKQILEIPNEIRPVALIPIGIPDYPDGKVPKKRPRKTILDIIIREKFHS
ncbi:MAG: nitroreductase family protein [Candidatus Lokiarchaeota archaeon]|nr:nitroreductase family protein [Candidatus Lokiarchaeota archaeon]